MLETRLSHQGDKLTGAAGSSSSGRRILASSGLSLLIGTAWISIEFAFAAFDDPGFDRVELARRLLRFLPIQLISFASIGVFVGAVNLRLRLDSVQQMGVVTLLASIGFLLPPLAWGLVRKGGMVAALPGLIGAPLAISAAALLLGWAARRLRPELMYGLQLGGIAAWSVLFIAFLRRAAPSFMLTRPSLSSIVDYGSVWHVGPALALAALICLLATRPTLRGTRAVGLCCAGILGVLAVSWMQTAAPPAPRDAGAGAGHPDILVILIDTLRADHVGLQRDGESLSPVLDSLSAESIRFERAFSPSSATRTSMPSMMTSLPVHVVGSQLAPEVTTFAEHLKQAGYATYGLSSNPIVSGSFGYQQGFDALVDPAASPDFLLGTLLKILGAAVPGASYHVGLLASDLYYRPIPELRRRALRLLDRTEPPAFVYLHTMDMHGPYLPPHEYLTEDYEPDAFLSYFQFMRLQGKGRLADPSHSGHLRNLRERYVGELQHTDRQLGILIDDLRARGRWDETLVWVLSDHGEAFGENDWAGHSTGLWTTLTRVPLMLRPPRSWGITPRVVSTSVSTRDVLPTTLALLGLAVPERVFGRDLSPLVRGGEGDADRIVFSANSRDGTPQYSAVQGTWRLQAGVDAEGTIVNPALYHIDGPGGEETEVEDAEPEVLRGLVAALEARLREEATWNLDTGESEIDALTRERLRSLGYVE